MADKAEPDRLQRVEMIARKELPLHHVLLFFGVVFCPVWILAAVAAAAELSFSSLPDNFYGVMNWTFLCSMTVTIIVAVMLNRKLTNQQAELSTNIVELSSYQLGYGVVKVDFGGWSYRIAGFLVLIFFLVNKMAGGDSAEMKDAALFWSAQGFFAYVAGLISCFLGFCLWLGHRAQKQRAANGGSA